MKTLSLLALAAVVCGTPLLAEDIWANTPLRPRQATMPLFPERLLLAGVQQGSVQLMIEVAPSGEVVDALATAYTHRPFADATLAAVERWSFQPDEVGHVAQINLTFRRGSAVVVVTKAGAEADQEVRAAFRPCPPDQLDERPRPVSTVQPPPAPPGSAEEAGVVILEYYIDQQGRVRMPVVQQTPDPLLAGLAIAAIKQWRFTPPTCEGQPTLVRAQQSFQFGDPSS